MVTVSFEIQCAGVQSQNILSNLVFVFPFKLIKSFFSLQAGRI